MSKGNNIDAPNFEAIERYLVKEMSEEEFTVFIVQLDTDKKLQQEVNEYRLIFTGIQEAALEKSLQEFHAALPAKPEPVVKVRRNNSKILAAVSVIGLILICSLLVFNNFNNKEKLFGQYYKPDPGLITSMGLSDNYDFDRAMLDYKRGDYDKALSTWKSILAENKGTDTLKYFIGSAYMADEQEDSAIFFLRSVADQAGYFSNDANWYLGLALLKNKQFDAAIQRIELCEHPGKEELLRALKRR